MLIILEVAPSLRVKYSTNINLEALATPEEATVSKRSTMGTPQPFVSLAKFVGSPTTQNANLWPFYQSMIRLIHPLILVFCHCCRKVSPMSPQSEQHGEDW